MLRSNPRFSRYPFSTVAVSMLAAVLAAGCNDANGNGDDSDNGSDSDTGGNGSADAAAEVPLITEISAEGAPVAAEGQVEIAVTASSPSGNALNYDWHIPDGWDGNDTGDSVLILTAPDDDDVRAEVQVVVRDGHLSRSAAIAVATDDEAVVEEWSVSLESDEPLVAGDSLDFSVQAFDPQGRSGFYGHQLGILLELDQDSNYEWTLDDNQAVGGIVRATSTAQVFDANAGMDVAVQGASGWPVRGGNRQRTGLSTSEQATVGSGDIVWESEPIGDEDRNTTLADRPPALSEDGILYIGGREYDSDSEEMHHFVYAVDTDDGSVKWSKPMDEYTMGTVPALGADGTVYLGSNDGYLYALDPQDGSTLWRKGVLNSGASPMIGSDGTIYVVRSSTGRLKAIEDKRNEGEVKWTFDSNSAYTVPALGPDDTLYFGDAESNLYAINPEDYAQEREKWVFEGEDRFDSSPAVGMDGTIYIGSDDDHLYAINPDGTEKWAAELDSRPNSIRSSPVIGPQGHVYVSTGNHNLYGLRPEDGSIAWEYEADGGIGHDPVMGPDGILYAYVDRSLMAFDPHDDSVVWTVDEGSADPILGPDGTVYSVGSGFHIDGDLIGIR